MEALDLAIFLLLGTVISAVLEKKVSFASLPLVQIVLGAVACLTIPDLAHVEVESELFMVLFIAPLLFDETRHVGKLNLLKNKAMVLSLAIGLVFATVLAVGFTINLIAPSIPLAAAFCLGTALGPTDAAAVAALGKETSLSARQETLLSGEALLNDASGVVSFQFAVGAVVTGAFSLVDASVSFVVSFLGGIALGLIGGILLRMARRAVRRAAVGSAAVDIVIEVAAPFVLYLAAEFVGVSGVIAVVAGGIAFSLPQGSTVDLEESKTALASKNVWEVATFVINGVVFTLLGIQIPGCARVFGEGEFSVLQLVTLVLVATLVVLALRWLWVLVAESIHDRKIGFVQAKSALILTIAGPKGAVTLSVIMTFPAVDANGAPIACGDALVFVAAGVIVLTLLLANFLLPVIAADDSALRAANSLADKRSLIVQHVVTVLCARVDTKANPGQLAAIGSYGKRVSSDGRDARGDALAIIRKDAFLSLEQALVHAVETGQVRQGDANEVLALARSSGCETYGNQSFLRRLSRFARLKEERTRGKYLKDERGLSLVMACEGAAGEVARNAVLKTLRSFVCCDDEVLSETARYLLADGERVRALLRFERNGSFPLTGDESGKQVADQLAQAGEVVDECFRLELETIRQLRADGRLSEPEARSLQQEVYVLQIGRTL